MIIRRISICILLVAACVTAEAQPVKVGLNYPKTGPYSIQGLAQLRAAEMAVEEINAAGGVLGRNIELVIRDSQSRPEIAVRNVEEMIQREGCEMIFGGSSSGVAIAGGQAARSKGKIYFGTLTYSNSTTGKDGHMYMFRECYNAWMGAKVLSDYIVRLRRDLRGKKYFYITADYTWGWTTEQSFRKFTNTAIKRRHKGVLTPFPGATADDFKKALVEAEKANPDVLVLVLFGNEMSTALTIATDMGLKDKMKAVIVPNLTLGMAESAGPKVMEGVLGALPWAWNVPYQYDYERGKKFVEAFSKRYNSYPSTSAASAYTILYQYKNAVERAKNFETRKVIAALEGHRFQFLKDFQTWRKFDHQCIQTVYAVECKPENEVLKDRFNQDFFKIINVMSDEESAMGQYNWEAARKLSGKPLILEW